MKSSFGRSFSTVATILLLALTVLGASFQLLVKEYLTETTIAGLRSDADAIANLAAAYSIEGSLSSREFLLNLDVASQVSEADIVICDNSGQVVLCSDALSGCEHQGLRLNREYLEKVLTTGSDVATGVIRGLYSDRRYVVSVPINSDSGA